MVGALNHQSVIKVGARWVFAAKASFTSVKRLATIGAGQRRLRLRLTSSHIGYLNRANISTASARTWA